MIVNIDKKTGIVVDINQSYDSRHYENREVPDGTVPKNFARSTYKLGDDGKIVEVKRTLLGAQYWQLGNAESLGEAAASPADRLIYVLHGQLIIVEDGRQSILEAGNSKIITKGVPHLISGNTERSVFVTAQL